MTEVEIEVHRSLAVSYSIDGEN